jgi:hypothetical protein
VTVASAEGKESLMVSGIEVKESLVSCHSIQPDTTVVTVKMPYEMADECATTVLARYGKVANVRRLTYRDYPTIETGVRSFKLVNVLPSAQFPQYITVGHYNLTVRVRGRRQRCCFRCGSPQHILKDCPEEQKGHRYDYESDGEDMEGDCGTTAQTGDIVQPEESSVMEARPEQPSSPQERRLSHDSESNPNDSTPDDEESWLLPPCKVPRQENDKQTSAPDQSPLPDQTPLPDQIHLSDQIPPSDQRLEQQNDRQQLPAGNHANDQPSEAHSHFEYEQSVVNATQLDVEPSSNAEVGSPQPVMNEALPRSPEDPRSLSVSEPQRSDDTSVETGGRRPFKLLTKHKKSILVTFDSAGRPLVPIEREGKVTRRLLRKDSKTYKELVENGTIPHTQ